MEKGELVLQAQREMARALVVMRLVGDCQHVDEGEADADRASVRPSSPPGHDEGMALALDRQFAVVGRNLCGAAGWASAPRVRDEVVTVRPACKDFDGQGAAISNSIARRAPLNIGRQVNSARSRRWCRDCNLELRALICR